MIKNLFLLSLFTLISCHKICLFSSGKVWLETISWSAHKDANNGMPTLFHLVYVYDEALLKKLSAKSSTDYFEEFNTLKQDFGDKVEIREYHIITGRSQYNIHVKQKKCGTKGAIAFARYNSNNSNQKHVLGEERDVTFIFKKDKVEVIKDKKNG